MRAQRSTLAWFCTDLNLRERFVRARDLYDDSLSSYANRLYNGTFYPRWAPTVFAPLLLNSTPPERVDKMMELMEDPATFCVGPAPEPNQPKFLWRMQAASKLTFLRAQESITCASTKCLQETVLGVADFVRSLYIDA